MSVIVGGKTIQNELILKTLKAHNSKYSQETYDNLLICKNNSHLFSSPYYIMLIMI